MNNVLGHLPRKQMGPRAVGEARGEEACRGREKRRSFLRKRHSEKKRKTQKDYKRGYKKGSRN